VTPPHISLDALAVDIVGRSGLRFTVGTDEATRETACRVRYLTIVDRGWEWAATLVDGQECDAYDKTAVHVIGWDGETPVATGRIVSAPGRLPTEDFCGFNVEPQGQIADVSRMTVSRSHQGPGHTAFIGLLARLYLEVRTLGFEWACGVMSVRARSLLRILGLHIEILGPEQLHWGELRAPVRFSMTINSEPDVGRWR